MDAVQVFAGFTLIGVAVGCYVTARAGYARWVGLPGVVTVAVGLFFRAKSEALGGYESIGPAVIALVAAALFIAMMLGALVGALVRWRRGPGTGISRPRADD